MNNNLRFLILVQSMLLLSLPSDALIYGADNIKTKNNFKGSAAVLNQSDSVFALVAESLLMEDPNISSSFKMSSGFIFSQDDRAFLSGYKIKEKYNLCSSEAWTEEVHFANCTGTLIAPDLMLTAAHCLIFDYQNKEFTCGTQRWLMKDVSSDEKTKKLNATNMDDGGNIYQLQSTPLTPNDFVTCKKVEYAKLANPYSHRDNNFQDIALVRLTHPVKDRAPVRIADQDPQIGQAVYTIGHPEGLSKKITSGAQIKEIFAHSFITNLDIFKGNSGGPVLNENGEILGFISQATTFSSYVLNDTKSCIERLRVPENGFLFDENRPLKNLVFEGELATNGGPDLDFMGLFDYLYVQPLGIADEFVYIKRVKNPARSTQRSTVVSSERFHEVAFRLTAELKQKIKELLR